MQMDKHIRTGEIISALKREISAFDAKTDSSDIGVVMQCGDGIAQVSGLDKAMSGELVEIEVPGAGKVAGIAMNLEEDSIGVIVLDDYAMVKEGHIVRRTGLVSQVPAGDELLGRIVDPLGRPLDDKPLGTVKSKMLIDRKAPGIVDRENVCEPLFTGIKAIDALIPIGRGQRELIIGDRRTGKTAIALDAIINQGRCGGEPVRCFYVAIGQKRSSVVRVVEKLREFGAMEYTTVVCATASEPAALQYLAPYAACAMAEHYRDSGRHALVVYDDLTKHAQAYRQISLLLRRPPGREAYPGDIFYLHSRLLERAAKMSREKGGGSLTALPIIETQAGDVSAYIPTNVISITDGQIFLESSLFNSGLRPAVNAGISVSRVGGSAQIKAMKQVAGSLRLELAQFRELASFSQFASDLDKATQAQLARGEKLTELLKQRQYRPVDIISQIMVLYAGTRGWIDKYPTAKLMAYERHFVQYLTMKHPDFVSELRKEGVFNEKLDSRARQILSEFESVFNPDISFDDVDAGINMGLVSAISHAGTPSRSELLRIVERFAEKSLPSDTLQAEIGQIFKEAEQDVHGSDIFDEIIGKTEILDFAGPMTREELFKAAAPILAGRIKSRPDDILARLEAREKLASTAMSQELAVPHMISEGEKQFWVLPARCRSGVKMSMDAQHAHIVFFLGGTIDMRSSHLVCLAAIAQIAGSPGFADEWMRASGAEELRSLILATKRTRRRTS